MREIDFGKIYESLVVWIRIVWDFGFIVNEFGAITMFMDNVQWTLF